MKLFSRPVLLYNGILPYVFLTFRVDVFEVKYFKLDLRAHAYSTLCVL